MYSLTLCINQTILSQLNQPFKNNLFD